MPGNLLPATQNHDLLDKTLHQDVLESVGRRRRIVICRDSAPTPSTTLGLPAPRTAPGVAGKVQMIAVSAARRSPIVSVRRPARSDWRARQRTLNILLSASLFGAIG